VKLEAADGHVSAAWKEEPKVPARGALVVIQSAYGVNDYLKRVCRSYADEGYVSIAPALYDRQRRDAVFEHTPVGSAAAQELRRGLDWELVMADVEAARAHVAPAGRVGIIGFCVGGSVAWIAAQRLRFAAASSYYGKDVVDFPEPPPKCPTILHFGDKDRLIPLTDVETIRRLRPEVPAYVYDAGHGFDGNNPEAAAIARTRTMDLFRTHLG
jgi:carboxymethylenebutenolidase